MLKINAVLDPNPNSWFAGSPSGSRVEGGERDEGLGEICELREKKGGFVEYKICKHHIN